MRSSRAGAIERDPAQVALAARDSRPLAEELGGFRLARKTERAGLAVRQAHPAPPEGPLSLGLGRPRQDHADGPVLRGARRFSASAASISTPSWPMCTSASMPGATQLQGRRRSRATIRSRPSPSARRRGLGAVLRRVHGHRHRRRHDPRPLVHGVVRPRRRGGRDLQRRAGRGSTKAASTATLFLPFIALLQERMAIVRARRPGGFPSREARRRTGLPYAGDAAPRTRR